MDNLRFAERDHVLGTGISCAAIAFAIKPLVLKEHHWIVAANRSAKQTSRIERVRRKDHAHPRGMGEDALAALRVIDGAAGKVSANRNSDDARRRKIPV